MTVPRPLLRYPGGKFEQVIKHISPVLAPALAQVNYYAEIMVGGGSVALWVAQEYPDLRIILNDKDPGVAALWRVCISDEHEELAERVSRFEPTHMSVGTLPEESVTDLDVAFQFLIRNRTAHGGRHDSGPLRDIASRYDGSKLAERIRRINELLRGRTRVFCKNAIPLIARLPLRAALYLDPPYPFAGRRLYCHVMAEDDHEALAAALRRRPGYWLLSNEDHAFVRNLYADYQTVPVNGVYSTANNEDWSGRRRSPELLIESHDLARLRHGRDVGLAVAGQASGGDGDRGRAAVTVLGGAEVCVYCELEITDGREN